MYLVTFHRNLKILNVVNDKISEEESVSPVLCLLRLVLQQVWFHIHHHVMLLWFISGVTHTHTHTHNASILRDSSLLFNSSLTGISQVFCFSFSSARLSHWACVYFIICISWRETDQLYIYILIINSIKLPGGWCLYTWLMSTDQLCLLLVTHRQYSRHFTIIRATIINRKVLNV